jgi:hypothetical protein
MIDATITLIDAYQKAWMAIQALGDDVDDETLNRASRIESDAMATLAQAPCRGKDFYLKLEYLASFLLKREEEPSVDDGYGALAIAVATHIER